MEFIHQKSLKSVNFWQSYWKNKKGAVFCGHCVVVSQLDNKWSVNSTMHETLCYFYFDTQTTISQMPRHKTSNVADITSLVLGRTSKIHWGMSLNPSLKFTAVTKWNLSSIFDHKRRSCYWRTVVTKERNISWIWIVPLNREKWPSFWLRNQWSSEGTDDPTRRKTGVKISCQGKIRAQNSKSDRIARKVMQSDRQISVFF